MHKEHDHSHVHEHTHTHDNDHDNDHDHGHDHVNGAMPVASLNKDLALLKYMLEHNKQHAHELAEAGGRLSVVGVTDPAELISDAVHYFDHANEKLEKAIRLIDGGV